MKGGDDRHSFDNVGAGGVALPPSMKNPPPDTYLNSPAGLRMLMVSPRLRESR